MLSPQEDKIVILQSVKTQQTLNAIYPDLPKANARIENDLLYRHWNQWEDEYKTHLFLHDLGSGEVVSAGKDLLKGEPYDGVLPPFSGSESVTFSGDGNFVYYSTKKMLGKLDKRD